VAMPVTLFLRLTGGRDDCPSPDTEKLVITGDRTMGDQLVANLAFTI